MDEDEEMYRLMNEEDEFYMGDTDDGDDDVKEEFQKYRCRNAGCVPLIIISSMLLGLFI